MLSVGYAAAKSDKTGTTAVCEGHDTHDRVQASTIVGGNHVSMDPCYAVGSSFDKERCINDAPANYAPAAFYAIQQDAEFKHVLQIKVKFEDIAKKGCYRAIDGFYMSAFFESAKWRNATFYDVSTIVDSLVPVFMGVRARDIPSTVDHAALKGCAPDEVIFYFQPQALHSSALWSQFHLVPYIMLGEGGVLAPTSWMYPERISAVGEMKEAKMSVSRRPFIQCHMSPTTISDLVVDKWNPWMRSLALKYASLYADEKDFEKDAFQLKAFVDSLRLGKENDAAEIAAAKMDSSSVKFDKGLLSVAESFKRFVKPLVDGVYYELSSGQLTDEDYALYFALTAAVYAWFTTLIANDAPSILSDALGESPWQKIASFLPEDFKRAVFAVCMKAPDSAGNWFAFGIGEHTYKEQIEALKIDKLQLTDTFAWDHSETAGSIVPCAPLYLLFRMERCIFDSLTTIVTTVKGAAQKGGLSTGIFPLLQLSSWAECFGWYAPSSEEDAFMAADLDAQYAGQSGFLEKQVVSSKGGDVAIKRSFWGGLVASSRRFFGRSQDFCVAQAKVAENRVGVNVVGLTHRATKVMYVDKDTGNFVTEPGSYTITKHKKASDAYSFTAKGKVIRLGPRKTDRIKAFEALLDTVI